MLGRLLRLVVFRLWRALLIARIVGLVFGLCCLVRISLLGCLVSRCRLLLLLLALIILNVADNFLLQLKLFPASVVPLLYFFFGWTLLLRPRLLDGHAFLLVTLRVVGVLAR